MFSVDTSKVETGDQEMTRAPGKLLQDLPRTVRGINQKFGRRKIFIPWK